MKKTIHIFLSLALLALACNKVELDTPDFAVTTASDTYKVNDTVEFRFQGNAGIISFYSGELLNDYAYINGRTVAIEEAKLSFRTRVQFGTQANQLSILVSTDFNGKYESFDDIYAATWEDITSNFTLPTVSSSSLVASGEMDVSDLIVEGKPMYVAFRYRCLPQNSTNGTQRTWSVQSFLFKTTTEIGSTEIGNQLTASWTLTQSANVADPGRSTISASSGSMVLRGNTVNTLESTDMWAISKPFSLDKAELGPDLSVPIKGTSDNQLTSFKHVFSKPGTYTVTFVAANVNVYDTKPVVKQVTLKITE